MKVLATIFLTIAIISFLELIIIWVNKVFDYRNKEIKSLQNELNDLVITLNTIFKIRMLRSLIQDQVYSQYNVNKIAVGELLEEREDVANELFNHSMSSKSKIEIDKTLDKLYEHH